jgi:hypothetical protein
METKLCECGCGNELDFTKGRKTKKFLRGHATRKDNRGSKARIGVEPWNKGIFRTQEEKEKMSNGQKHSYSSGKRKKYTITPEHREKLNKSVKHKTKEHTRKIIKSRENNPNYLLTKKRISDTLKRKYKNGEIKSSFYIDGRYNDNPNSQYNLYNGQFTESLKLEIRKRDNWTCQLCNKKRSTNCHHIDENKSNNIIDNLIVLCRSCHSKYHSCKEEKKTELKKLFVILTQRYKCLENV